MLLAGQPARPGLPAVSIRAEKSCQPAFFPEAERPQSALRWRHDDSDTPEELYAIWDSTRERSLARLKAALADGGLDQPVHLEWPGRGHLSLRRLICDLIEEYGRHTGHADLLREAVDGRVGEDPPPGWHPVSGQPELAS